jgi:hypothetical protein
MRAILFVSAVLVLVGSSVIFFASLVVRQYNWAYQVCTYSEGLCDRWAWLAIAAAMAGFVAFVIRATEI